MVLVQSLQELWLIAAMLFKLIFFIVLSIIYIIFYGNPFHSNKIK